jgi:hypothetical protein
MPSHKFHIGDSVMLKPAISRNVPGGVYEVIKQLPHNGRESGQLVQAMAGFSGGSDAVDARYPQADRPITPSFGETGH